MAERGIIGRKAVRLFPFLLLIAVVVFAAHVRTVQSTPMVC